MTKFSWGDSVRVKRDAPGNFANFEFASVCGIRTVDDAKVAEEFGVPMHTVLYIVEFSNGSSIEIPENYLETF